MKKNFLFSAQCLIVFLSFLLIIDKANCSNPVINSVKAEGPDLTIDSYRTLDGRESHNFGTITVKEGGNLRFLDTFGNVSLTCQKLVLTGGVVTIDATSGIYINCGEIEVLAGKIISTASGLNLSCRGITNYGQININTPNNIYVAGDIVNGAGINYRGNGIVFSGNKIVQTNDTATFNVSGIANTESDKPLYLGGNIQFKNTAFNIGKREVKKINSQNCKLNFDGGYLILADGSMDSIDIDGKNGFYISDGIYTHSQWTGNIELSGWNTQVANGSKVDATIVPKGFYQLKDNIWLEANNYLYTSGNVLFRGVIKDSLRLQITMRVHNTLTNYGYIRTKMDVYGGGNLNNYGTIVNETNFFNDNLYMDLPLGDKKVVNAGKMIGRIIFNTDYQVNSGSGSGYWKDYVASHNQFKKIEFFGKHVFDSTIVAHVSFNKDAVITAQQSKFWYIKGEKTFTQQKSANEYKNISGFNIYGAGKMTFIGNNICDVVALDSISFKYLDMEYPVITGNVQNAGPVVWNGTFDMYTINGEWINNGTVLNQGSVNGYFVNNGTVDAALNVNGSVFSNGKWTSGYNKNLTIRFVDGYKYLWLVNDGTIATIVNLTAIENSYNKTWYKNGSVLNYFGDAFMNVTKADTALYQAKNPSNVWSGKLQVAVKNPFTFTEPLQESATVKPEVLLKWRRIPGATAYKVRISYISDKNNQEYVFLTDTMVTDTALTVSGLGQFKYKAYLSVRFGFEGNYTWSQECYPYWYNNGTVSGIEQTLTQKLNFSPTCLKPGESILIKGLNPGNVNVLCIDLSGRIVAELFDGNTSGQLNIAVPNALKAGFYMIKTTGKSGESVNKIQIY